MGKHLSHEEKRTLLDFVSRVKGVTVSTSSKSTHALAHGVVLQHVPHLTHGKHNLFFSFEGPAELIVLLRNNLRVKIYSNSIRVAEKVLDEHCVCRFLLNELQAGSYQVRVEPTFR